MYFLALETFFAFLFPLQLLNVSIKMPDSKFVPLALHCHWNQGQLCELLCTGDPAVSPIYTCTPSHREPLADLKEWPQTRPLLLGPPGLLCLEAYEKCRTSRPASDLQNLHFNEMPGVLTGTVSVRTMQLGHVVPNTQKRISSDNSYSLCVKCSPYSVCTMCNKVDK